MIPYRPEPLQALRKRYPKAVARVFDSLAVKANPTLRPGKSRTHVFDFQDGIRLIVSVDTGVGLHVSASFIPDTALDRRLKKYARNAGVAAASDRLKREGEDAYRRLVGPETRLEFLGFLEGEGIPHWRADHALTS